MANIVSEKQINAFVKGLITEASPLTYPENASLDEENFDLEINGSRSRRLGVDYETSFQLNATGFSTAVLQGTQVSGHNWSFPGGSTSVVLGLIRVYNRIYFVDLLQANPSAHLKNSGNYITISNLTNSKIQVTIINGYCLLVSEELNYPIVLSYDAVIDIVTQEEMPIEIRDLYGVDDGYSYDARPTTLTNLHKYNLINQGWNSKIVSICSTPAIPPTYARYIGLTSLITEATIPATTVGAIDCTKTTLGVFPSNADTWVLGKTAVTTDATAFQKYDPNILVKNSIDNFPAPKGAIILDSFNRGTDRQIKTGVTGLPLDRELSSFSTIVTYAGRVFYSGITSQISGGDRVSPNYSSYIFFSQTAISKDKFGKCYQENDPTSPNISDLVDSDGGTIQIPGVNKVIALVVNRSSLLVFAENGLWEIVGDTAGFKATSYQVNKISDVGIYNSDSIVNANGTTFYWAKTGIHMLVPDQTTGRLATQNISLNTIQTKYNSITELGKKYAKGFFDSSVNHIRWLYNDDAAYAESNYTYHYNKELNLDLGLQAFYIFSISSLVVNSPSVCGYMEIPTYSLTSVGVDVYAGTNLVEANSIQVQTTENISTTRTGTYNFITFTGDSFTLSKYKDTTFYDWISVDGIGVNFSSYLITGYEISNDILRMKQVPYILFYFSRTEDGYTLDSSGNLVNTNQSGCLVQAQWNWANSANSGHWGTAFQAYRLLRNYIPSGVGDTFDYGDGVIVTKNKLRGSGRCLSLKIQSVAGKDCHLLGWANTITADPKP
jgi:hypothetical protein